MLSVNALSLVFCISTLIIFHLLFVATVPTVPRDLEIIAGYEAVMFTLSDPADDGGEDLTGYYITLDFFVESLNTTSNTTYVSVAHAQNFTVTGGFPLTFYPLPNDANTTIIAAALNAMGMGNFSSNVSASTCASLVLVVP